jgi:transcriptional regulator with XRE-family HTH domain
MASRLTLRELRLANGWTQPQLAKRSGVSKRTIAYIEAGTVRPQAPTRKRLLRALSVHFDNHPLVFGPLKGKR